jgi:hypothetical protein
MKTLLITSLGGLHPFHAENLHVIPSNTPPITEALGVGAQHCSMQTRITNFDWCQHTMSAAKNQKETAQYINSNLDIFRITGWIFCQHVSLWWTLLHKSKLGNDKATASLSSSI